VYIKLAYVNIYTYLCAQYSAAIAQRLRQIKPAYRVELSSSMHGQLTDADLSSEALRSKVGRLIFENFIIIKQNGKV